MWKNVPLSLGMFLVCCWLENQISQCNDISSALHVQRVDWMATTGVTVLFHLLSLSQLPSGKVGTLTCIMPSATSCLLLAQWASISFWPEIF